MPQHFATAQNWLELAGALRGDVPPYARGLALLNGILSDGCRGHVCRPRTQTLTPAQLAITRATLVRADIED